jgi:hypothetical protein
MRLSSSLLVLLAGCATSPAYYQQLPTAEICRGLHTLPPMNVNHGTRLRELERRGESCGTPEEIARSQMEAQRNMPQPVFIPPPPRPLNCVTTTVGSVAQTTCY